VPRNWWRQKKDVLRHYNRLARIYDSLYGEEQNAKIKSILRMVKTRCEDLVLDAGCGTGLLIDHVAARVNHFVGLDVAEKALKVASERSRRLRIRRNVSLIRADVDALPFRDNIFDKIFALTLLQNVPEPCRTLREMVRAAKDMSEVAVTGLKKRFTEEDFSEIIRRIGMECLLVEDPEIHDFIAVIKVNKVKDKYGEKKE